GIPPLAGFFSKDEILWKTFSHGNTVLWAIAVIAAFLTATYMFRLLYLAFFGERRHAPAPAPAHSGHGTADAGHGHGDHLHDAPSPMAIALVVLAIGSVLAGFVGVPHVLGGSNRIETFLEPSFQAAGHETGTSAVAEATAGEAEHGSASTEFSLMALSTLVA